MDATVDIYLDLNAGDSGEGLVLNTFAHELYHHIEKWSPRKARQLAQFLVKELGLESVEAMVEQQVKKAEAAGHGVKYFMKRGMSKTAAENTVQARAFSDFVADSLETVFTKGNALETLQRLKKTDRGLVERMKDFVNRWLSKLKEFYKGDHTITIDGQATAQLEKFEQIQKLFMDALVDAGENFQNADTVAAEKNTADGGEMYSIRNTSDGRTVAVVDDDVLSNINLSNWNEQTKKTAREAANEALKKFSDGIIVNGITRKVNRVSRREYTRSNYSEQLAKKFPDIYVDKMRAADVLDDIVVATTDWARDGGLRHPRTDSFVDFDHGKVLIESGDNQYSAEVVVGITNTGEAVFYDVVDLQPTQFDTEKTEPSTTATTNNSSGDIHEGSAKNKLAQPDQKVKTNSNETEIFSDRNETPTSNRDILLNTSEETVQTDLERKLLQRYKEKVQEIADVDGKLDYTKQLIWEYSSDSKYKSKTMVWRKERIALKEQLRKLNNELRNIADLKPLQDVLKREKDAVKKH